MILNLGGITNVSILPAGQSDQVYGFDTGPANILMDAWCQRYTGQPFDENGNWAAYGTPIRSLLTVYRNMSSSQKSHLKVPPRRLLIWNGWMNRLLIGAMIFNMMNLKIHQRMCKLL